MPKTACLVFHYFGEGSYVNRLAQETVPVHLALTDYDKTVLLRHETDIGPFELSEAAEKKATVLDTPTKENLAKYLNELGDEGYIVDVYVFAHGWYNKFLCSNGTYGDNSMVSDKYLAEKVRPLKLRMVWQCNCYGSTMNPTWAQLGAKAVAGTRFINYFPTRFAKFTKGWLEGQTFAKALEESNKPLSKRFWVHTYITGDAIAQAKKWGGNVFKALGVLGYSKAAKDYFTACWDENTFQDGQSGKSHMSWSSDYMVEGDSSITKATTDLKW